MNTASWRDRWLWNIEMRGTFISVLMVSALAISSAGCVDRTVKSGTVPPSNCLKDLSSIPEMGAVLKSRKHDVEESQGRPFEGLELALIINGMLKSQIDPDADADDLCFTENTPENFDRLASALKANAIPPTVSFIRGRWLDERMQREWMKRGNLTGSLGFHRLRAGKSDAQDYIENIARNDKSLAPFWEGSSRSRKYFRFSRTKLRRRESELETVKTYLKEHKYVLVTATIELLDERFSQLYCGAVARGDQSCTNLIKANFRSLALDTTLKARSITKDMAGRDVKQILVLGANQFTCDNLSDLLAWYKSLGARFISLDEALTDPFYSSSRAGSVTRQTRKAQLAAADKR